jgi:hypothetical protein
VRTESAVSAGFAKLDGLFASLAWLAPPELATKWSGLVRATPHRGQVPLLYFARVRDGERVEAVSEVYIPVEMTRDLATLVVMVAAELGLDDKN